jgi:GT2 family glycosyltransferase
LSRSPQAPFALVPERDVIERNGQTIATSAAPWLRLEADPALYRARWLTIRYRTSFFDDPVRPLIRFTGGDGGETVSMMTAPVAGRATWTGPVPEGTTGICISPTDRPGPFAFCIDAIRPLPGLRIFARAARSDPAAAVHALALRLIGAEEEARRTLLAAAGTTALQTYPTWRARNTRPLDLAGIDRPRIDWRSGPHFRLFTRIDGTSEDALRTTLASLKAQVYPNWSLVAVTDDAATAFHRFMQDDARFAVARLDDPVQPFASEDGAYLGAIPCGDALAAHAFAVLAEILARRPHWTALYCDEEESDGARPLFKPDYSAELQKASDYCGPLTLVHAALCRSCGSLSDFLEAATRTRLLATAAPHVGHVRRILNRRATSPTAPPRTSPARTASSATPQVSIVIPTRDRADLLKPCLDGLMARTDYPHMRIVIVDNGSTATDARALLDALAANPRISILARPGPFNYSALCNDGAAVENPDILVFLNNDIVVADPGWLRPLVAFAARPDIGAVGPKLLFPNGEIQHAGVVLGLHGCAGHPYYRAPKDARSYRDDLTLVREVSAVTGACLAVEKRKFDAVGGFDAVNLPVSLNDVDLCLRLSTKGWRCLWTPEPALQHVESASRGYYRADDNPHRAEDAFFMHKWGHLVRDDPFFHPAFSLASHDIRLDA